MARDSEPVSFEGVEIISVFDAAFLCKIDGDKVMIPKSQILEESNFGDDSEEGDSGELIIPEWLAIDRGLV